jgi:hypothetical protein
LTFLFDVVTTIGEKKIEYTNECVNKERYNFYENIRFNNIQHIGIGGFGKIFRASWKNSEKKNLH